MKYVLRPVEIDAVYYDGYKFSEEPDWIKEALKNHDLEYNFSYIPDISPAGYSFKVRFQGSYSRKLYPDQYLVKDPYGRLIPYDKQEFNILFKQKD